MIMAICFLLHTGNYNFSFFFIHTYRMPRNFATHHCFFIYYLRYKFGKMTIARVFLTRNFRYLEFEKCFERPYFEKKNIFKIVHPAIFFSYKKGFVFISLNGERHNYLFFFIRIIPIIVCFLRLLIAGFTVNALKAFLVAISFIS